jgi:D-alanyl-D-alanine dipeptidase
MNDKRRTDEEIAQLIADECRIARERPAERQRLADAMRAAGFATPKPRLEGAE